VLGRKVRLLAKVPKNVPQRSVEDFLDNKADRNNGNRNNNKKKTQFAHLRSDAKTESLRSKLFLR